jgi:hypothetical protein
MRVIWGALLAIMALAGSARAATFDDPKALLAALYDPYTHGQKPDNLPGYYSDGLKMMFAKHIQQAELSNGIAAAPDLKAAAEPDFDPFVDGKRYLLFDLVISDPVVSGDHALVNVSYKNFDHPSVISVSLVKGAEGWKVDDVASMGTDQHWMLSWLLTYDPLGQH